MSVPPTLICSARRSEKAPTEERIMPDESTSTEQAPARRDVPERFTATLRRFLTSEERDEVAKCREQVLEGILSLLAALTGDGQSDDLGGTGDHQPGLAGLTRTALRLDHLVAWFDDLLDDEARTKQEEFDRMADEYFATHGLSDPEAEQ